MSKSTRGFRAAGIASLAVSVSIGVAAPAFAVEGFTLERIGGEDRYETAALVADEYSATNDNVILANGQPGFYADALASNYLAGVLDAPILLTNMKQIPEYTLDQLDQMNAQTVTVVGGEGVVPPAQVEQLEDAGYTVERVAGDDRFETNADVIAEGDDATGGIGLIATGFDFPDALAAGPFAYQGHPLGLSTEDSVKDVVLDALVADGVEEVLIFGGESVVGQGVEDDLASRGITVLERFDGDDRSDTSELAAEWALENLDFVDTHVGVASGYTEGYGADALAGGPLEGKEMSPMLITRNVDNPDDALDYIAAHSDTLEDGHLYGGPGAVSVAAEAAMEEAGQGDAPASNQDYTVNPAGAQSNTADSDNTSDNVSLTFSGITTANVDAMIIPCEDVTVSNTGLATFEDDENKSGTDETVLEGNDRADDEDVPAAFITANGATVSGEYLDDLSVVNGSVSLSLDSPESDCVRVVVFDDPTDNNVLDLDANNQPVAGELFGISGAITFTAGAATTGTIGGDDTEEAVDAVNVASTDKANNSFAGCDIEGANAGTTDESVDNTECATYNYDANDRFFIGGTGNANQATLEQFEANITPGDDVTGEYNSNPALQSTFVLTDEAPTAPASASAQRTPGAEDSSAKLTFADSTDATVDSYNVYRGVDSTPETNCPEFRTASGAVASGYTLLTTVTDTKSSGTYEVVDATLAPSTKYCYAVTAVDEGDESSNQAMAGVVTLDEAIPDEGAPLAEDTKLTTSSGLGNTLDTGDVFKIVFNEPMAAPVAGDTLRVQDNDTTVADIINGTNATFSLNTSAETVNGVSSPAGTVLTVTITAVPTQVSQNEIFGIDGVQLPAYIIDQAGISDVSNNNWDVSAAGQDTTIDQNDTSATDDTTDGPSSPF